MSEPKKNDIEDTESMVKGKTQILDFAEYDDQLQASQLREQTSDLRKIWDLYEPVMEDAHPMRGTVGPPQVRGMVTSSQINVKVVELSEVELELVKNIGLHDIIMNQLLTKMDGMKSLNNVLLTGMTARKDLLDNVYQVTKGKDDRHMLLELKKIVIAAIQEVSWDYYFSAREHRLKFVSWGELDESGYIKQHGISVILTLPGILGPKNEKGKEIKTKQLDITNVGFRTAGGSVQIIKDNDIKEVWEIGSGTFGTVCHGKWLGIYVAIKRINDRCFVEKSSVGCVAIDQIHNESEDLMVE
ncbi:hypothetical protein V6N11_028562 [Hibiscus sabdariffa]|uniref:Vesicle-fusing ATPase n=1 Tax=Hibiscus sabdariffa TaxID=183260 RepID=A0ABR1ZZR0_9ROSI